MNHLSGDQIIRLLFSESQEFVDEFSPTAFAMAHRARPPRKLSDVAADFADHAQWRKQSPSTAPSALPRISFG